MRSGPAAPFSLSLLRRQSGSFNRFRLKPKRLRSVLLMLAIIISYLLYYYYIIIIINIIIIIIILFFVVNRC